jgi:hypothetical protein
MTFGSSAKSDNVYVSAHILGELDRSGLRAIWHGRIEMRWEEERGKRRRDGTYHMIFLEES